MGFLPVTRDEMRKLGWRHADVILVSGDAYVDSPYSGVAVIGQVLAKAGYRVAILSQPDMADSGAFRSLGEPNLFWGVSPGCVDSMVANLLHRRPSWMHRVRHARTQEVRREAAAEGHPDRWRNSASEKAILNRIHGIICGVVGFGR